MDLFFRKIVRDQGQALTTLLTEVQEFAKADDGNGALAAERDLLARRRWRTCRASSAPWSAR